jgi:hypothetical protein
MLFAKSTSWTGLTGLESAVLSCHQAKKKEPFGSYLTLR